MNINFNSIKTTVATTTVVVLLGSCTRGMNFYDEQAYFKNQAQLYAQSWVEKFGAIDPEQDWSMASQVTASISATASGNGAKAMLYSDNPFTTEASLLAELKLSKATTITFDAPKGLTQLYAIINDGTYNVSQGFYNINNSRVDITGSPVAKAKAALRTRSGSCPVTIGNQIDLGSYKGPVYHDAVYETSWDGKTYVKWGNNGTIAYYVKMENGKYYISTDNSTWSVGTFDNPWYNELYYNGQQTGIVAETDGSGLLGVGNDTDTWNTTKYIAKHKVSDAWTETFPYCTMYELNGVESSEGQSWKQGVGYEMYGPGKFFGEYVKYWTGDKPRLPGYDINKIEKGASITTTSQGPLTLSYVYGATQIVNAFGYFYWVDGQDKSKAPRYVLIKDARPDANIHKGSWTGATVGNMDLAVWSNYEAIKNDKDREPYDYEIIQGNTPMQKYVNAYNQLFVGTDYKMAYFGKDYDQSATYDFPANVHVEFFIINTGSASNPDYKTNLGNFNYGDPELNKEMMHYSMRMGYNPSYGAVKGATWIHNDVQYIGFEDGGYDEDLNDIVFVLDGNVDKTDIIEVPSEEPVVEPTSWIIACEDLGSTDDYDFNDIVFSVSHQPGETKALIQPLAAGGIYEAHILYNNLDLGEIHQLLGQEADEEGNYPMINTGSGPTGYASPIEITVPSDFTMSNSMGGLNIRVTGKEGTMRIWGTEKGTAPQMLLLEGNWKWPKERKPIQEAYKDFPKWNSNSNSTEWAKHPSSGSLW